jgi:hypothetical protein
VAEGDVVPLWRAQRVARDLDRGALRGGAARPEHVGDLAVQQQHVPAPRRVGDELGALVPRHVGHGEHRQVPLGEVEALGRPVDDAHAALDEQPEDAPRLGGLRRVVVAGDHHEVGGGERQPQPHELLERVEDRRVARPHGVEHVAGDDDEVGRERDRTVDGARERFGDVGLALVDAGGREALVLAEAEVQVGEVDESHAGNLPAGG